MYLNYVYVVGCMIFFSAAEAQEAKIFRQYSVPQSRQGVAVDQDHFYVINNSSITRHTRKDGKLVAEWTDQEAIFQHLNGGIIIGNNLYCTNSNYPDSPMASSIEIFNPEHLTHLKSHSFGIAYGSATWLDFYDGHWYVAFAHYTGRGSTEGKDNRWSRLVKFDEDWHFEESWIFPDPLLERFGTRSNSGGCIVDGAIYATGHDNYELYELKFPQRGYTLEWVDTHPVGSYGQGIACEVNEDKLRVYGVIKSENVVVVSEVDLHE